jgi:hypothetical protein
MAQRHREPVDVHLILRRGGEVLLSRRAGDTYASGLLHMPSGHLDGDFEDVVTGLSGKPRRSWASSSGRPMSASRW